ncbi:hypothetical protein ACLM5H_25735 [Fredinandcohnia humi]
MIDIFTMFTSLPIIMLVIFILIICLYFIKKHKEQAIQVFTLESFFKAYHLHKDESQNKGIIDTLHEFFNNNGTIDGSDNGESNDGVDDGGE